MPRHDVARHHIVITQKMRWSDISYVWEMNASNVCKWVRLKPGFEGRDLLDVAELDAEGLHLSKEVAHIDDLVLDEALQEHANKAHQVILHVLVLYVLAAQQAVRYVDMHELGRQVHGGRQAFHHLHGMHRDLHVHQGREVVRDLRAAHQFQQHLVGHLRVLLYEVWELLRRQAAVLHQIGVVREAIEDHLKRL